MSVKLYDGDEGRVLMMVGMTSVLLAAATWLLAASKFGLPVSTTHSAVGGVIAFAICSKGYDSVKWEKVGMIVASWFISPVMSAVAGALIYSLLYELVLKHRDSYRRAKLAAPVVVFFMTFVVALFTIYKGGKGVGLHKTTVPVALAVSFGIASLSAVMAYLFVPYWAKKIDEAQAKEEAARTKESEEALAEEAQTEESASLPQESQGATNTEGVDTAGHDDPTVISLDDIDQPVEPDEVNLAVKDDGKQLEPDKQLTDDRAEQFFTGFVVIMAGFFSLAHGANDVANSVGPFGAVLAAFEGPLEKKTEIPIWVFVGAGCMIVVGLATYGIHVMRTIGNNIASMSPSKAFCVNFASTLVVLIATRAGIPISTTHASVGAVVGVGLAQGVREVNWKVMAKVFLSWILTLPIVAITASGIFALLLPTVVNVPFASQPS
jgi:sodium-dependent phosphate transporter